MHRQRREAHAGAWPWWLELDVLDCVADGRATTREAIDRGSQASVASKMHQHCDGQSWAMPRPKLDLCCHQRPCEISPLAKKKHCVHFSQHLIWRSRDRMQEFKYKMPILRARGVGNACGTLFREAISTDTEKFERKLKSKPAVAEWTML